MVESGVRVDLSDIPGIKVDKHSTGGVGDKTSLVIAPLVAACGGVVPMMSGRGLGHTGGTLDKLESIPGFRTNLSIAEMRASLAAIGCAMIGQTAQIAPADKKLYALRDVTGTIESMPLISASIMSKKIAEGIDALVLDVKCGKRRVHEDAGRRPARWPNRWSRSARPPACTTQAVITAMDWPIGLAVGNANEVVECIEVLKGQRPPRPDRERRSSSASACSSSAGVADDRADARPVPPGARLGCGAGAVPGHHRAAGRQPARDRRLQPHAAGPGRARHQSRRSTVL